MTAADLVTSGAFSQEVSRELLREEPPKPAGLPLKRVRFTRGVELGSITTETVIAGAEYTATLEGSWVRVVGKGRTTLVPMTGVLFAEPE